MLRNEPKPHEKVEKEEIENSIGTLQRAEIAEIGTMEQVLCEFAKVSVLFNEPKLLKSSCGRGPRARDAGFSALQRAEIAEIHLAQ